MFQIDEVERSVREVNKLLGENYVPNIAATSNNPQEKKVCRKNILSVQHKHLNPNNELKRIFGSKIIQNEQYANLLKYFQIFPIFKILTNMDILEKYVHSYVV